MIQASVGHPGLRGHFHCNTLYLLKIGEGVFQLSFGKTTHVGDEPCPLIEFVLDENGVKAMERVLKERKKFVKGKEIYVTTHT